MPTWTAGILVSPVCLANGIPTEEEKIVKMIWVSARWMADSSAVTSVAIEEGLQTPATSIPILGMVASNAGPIGSAHAAFSMTAATLILGMFKDCFTMAATVPKWVKAALTRNVEL